MILFGIRRSMSRSWRHSSSTAALRDVIQRRDEGLLQPASRPRWRDVLF